MLGIAKHIVEHFNHSIAACPNFEKIQLHLSELKKKKTLE